MSAVLYLLEQDGSLASQYNQGAGHLRIRHGDKPRLCNRRKPCQSLQDDVLLRRLLFENA